MRIHNRIALILLYAAALLTAPSLYPQSAASANHARAARPELAVDFTFLRSNAPVGGCGCFGIYGGSATFAYPIGNSPFAVVADATSGVSTNITASNFNLLMSVFTAGARYSPELHVKGLHPFVQAMAGTAHASQSLVNGSSGSVPNASAAFAFDAGGGVDLALNRKFRVRLAQASYLMTTFDNGSNNRQNNLRLSAGLVLRF